MQTIIDTSRLRQNIRRIRGATRNEFCAVVKANAYGHGLYAAYHIQSLADCFLVATAEEAYALCAITDKPILMLGGQIDGVLKSYQPQIIPTVCNVKQLIAVKNSGYKRFSVAVNTGMNRLGADENALNGIASICKQYDMRPWSVYSHIYGGISSAAEQSELFDRLTSDELFRVKRHLYSSVALDLKPRGFDIYDMTRCGIAMYGYGSGTDICMKVRAKIVALNRVSRGEHVGYGDYTLDHDAMIATVDCGYADGLRRSDRQLYLKVRGVKCNVVGKPCMDLTMIDVTGAPCRVGEYAYLISDKSDTEYLAACYNTIVYEVLTGFNGRAERIYV